MPEENRTFDGIALALSGGGYRAAAFHLGMLKMLDRLGLRDRVQALSTISGGTIFGIAYVKSLVEKKDFDVFAAEFRDFMRSTNVVAVALEQITDTRHVNGLSVMPSLIRSAANVYAETIYNQTTFGDVLDSDIAIKEISFNATEFKTGRAFRFQTGESNSIYSGNQDLRVGRDTKTNRATRLADIAAASSCFPSGFEPLRFPSDFVWNGDINLEGVRAELGKDFKDEIPLMDGGVFDNQGMDSIYNIFERENQDTDLLIISDTDPDKSGYLESPAVEDGGWLSLSRVYLLIQFVMVLALFSAAAVGVNLYDHYRDPGYSWFSIVFLNVVPLIFAVSVFVTILWSRTMIRDLLDGVEESMELPVWASIRQLTVKELIELVRSRAKSLIAMSADVFMRRIRSLEYQMVLSDGDLNPITISNTIYGLEKDPSLNAFEEREWIEFVEYEELVPSGHLRAVSEKARDYGTNLWFLETDNTNLDNLIKCGEASICYKLLLHLLTQKQPELRNPNSEATKLFHHALSLWKEMNEIRLLDD